MSEIISAAVKSVVQEKGKHVLNLTTNGGAAALAGMNALDVAVIIVPLILSTAVSLMLIRKTYLENKLLKIELAKQGRRQSDC